MIEKVEALIKAAEELENKNPKEALELAKEAYEIANKENFITEKAQSLIRVGRCLWLMGRYHEAVNNLNKALEISKTLESGIYEVEALKALGNIQTYLNINDNAINFYAKALKIVKRDNLTHLEPSLLNNMGGTYLNLEDIDSALFYLTQCFDKCKQVGDRLDEIVCTFNLGEIYYKKQDYEKSRDYTLHSLQLSQEDEDIIGTRHSLYLLGLIEKANGQNEKAFDFFEQSLKVAYETSDLYGQVDILIDMSDIYTSEEKYKEGIEKLHEALAISEQMDGNTFAPTIYSKLAKAYEQMGNRDQTMMYYKLFHEATISANELSREEKLRSISFQLELEQSQQETETYRELMRELEKKTNELSESYEQIKIVSEIGQSITSTLDLEKSFNRIYENINKLMKSNSLGIGLYNKEEDCIEFNLFKEDGIDMPPSKIPLSSEKSWAVWVFKNKKEILINDVENEYTNYLKGNMSVGPSMNSLIFFPLIVEGTNIGVFTVQSEEKNAYEKKSLDTMSIFASYIAIAINNAQKSQQLAEEIKIKEKAQQELESLNKKLLILSDLDGLTNIANRRCFNKVFKEEWTNGVENNKPLSVLLIDVDKFKEYNDHYGHLEGDAVLQQIAKGIEDVTLKYKGTAARYGGDEFVVLVPNSDHDRTIKIAHDIKNEIAGLAIKHEYSSIKNILTLSIGCFTDIPNGELEKEYLLNKADEALYLAKGKGRDRVEYK